YYESCLQEVEPEIRRIIATIGELRHSAQIRESKALQESCELIDNRLSGLLVEMRGLTDLFRTRTKDMWQSISHEHFEELKALIQSFQTEVGRNLCIAVVKAKAWSRHFPTDESGGLSARARIMTSEIRPGIERLAHFKFADRGAISEL